MATRSNRDVTLTLAIQSLGAEGIKELQAAVSALARDGGDAAPEFQQLADQIGRLGEQSQALSAFRNLSEETDQLRGRQEAATQTATELSNRLKTLSDATEQARQKQAQASAEYDQADVAVTKVTGAIRAYKSETDQATKQTADYRIKLGELVRAQTEAATTLKEASQARRDANTALKEAEADEAKLEKQYTRSAMQLDKLGAALKEQDAALRAAAASAEQLGVSADDVATAEGQLLTALQATANRVNERSAAIREMAESDRLAAIQEQGMIDLLRKGEQALQAEILAQRDAAKAVQEYERAKQAATAANAAWQQEAAGIVDAAHAAQQLARETEVLAAVQKELTAQRTFERQAEEARKLMQAAEYVRFWQASLEQAEAQARQTAEAAAQAASKIDTAFATLGVRSIQTVQDEIAQTRAAMATLGAAGTQTGSQLAGAFAAGEAKIKLLEREIRELNGTLTLGDRAANLFKNSLGQIAAGNLVADGVGYLINKVKELGAAFVSTIAQTESLVRGLNAVYKDMGITASQMLFLRSTALGAGVAVGDLGPSFLKFSAATKSSNIPLETTNALFAAVTKAAGTLGLSGEQVSGMLEALGQMASKGTVSMEELRQQLGDRLPGALSLVAQGFGITEAELIKLVESGQLAARDLFPALTKSLQSMSGEVTGLTPAYQNLKTTLTSLAQEAGDAGWTEILTGGLKLLTAAVGVVGGALLGITNVLALTGAGVVALYGALTGDKGAWGFFLGQIDAAADRQSKFSDAIDQALQPTKALGAAVKDTGNAMQQSAQLTYVLQQATVSTAAGLQLQETATKLMGDTTLDASQKVIKMNVEVGKLLPQLEAQAVAADKVAKAVKIEGDALVATIALRGSERDSLDAQLQASQRNLEATTKAAEVRQAETEALVVQRDTLIRLASVLQGGLEARKQELEAIDKKILTSAAETEQAKAAVTQLQQEIATRAVARQTYEDNSAALDQFKAAAVAAQVALELLRKGFEAGTVTQAQYSEAQRGSAMAMALYRDALADTTAKIDALSKVEQANYNVKLAGLSVQQQAYQQLANAAKATGDLNMATYYEIEAKKIQIEVTRLTAEAKSKEAEATTKAAQSELEALKATNSLTEVKRLEIEARIANAKAKQVEATGAATVIRALEAEIDVIRRKGVSMAAGTAATNANTSATNANTDAISRAMDVREKEIAQKERKIALDEREAALAAKAREGSASMSSDLMTRTGIVNFLKAAGVDDEARAKQIANEFADSNGDIVYSNNGGQFKYGGRGSTISQALLKAAEQYTFSESRVNGGAKANPGAVAPDPAPTAPKDTSSGKTVTINVGGRSQSVKVASDADANNLIAILRQLESSAGTAA